MKKKELAQQIGTKGIKDLASRLRRDLKKPGAKAQTAILDGIAAWLGYTDFSNLQLHVAEQPAPGKAKTPAIPAPGVQLFWASAEQHGKDSEPDHEVGDLQDLLRIAYDMLSAEQKLQFAVNKEVRQIVETGDTDSFDALEELAELVAEGEVEDEALYVESAAQLYGWNEVELSHARGCVGLDYGEEIVLQLSNGRQLRCPSYPCDYARVTQAGFELAYWSSDEFGEAPEEVLGALFAYASRE